ncbi:MAG: BamA/TamA family outer membrane protein [Agriterribacter sp.]
MRKLTGLLLTILIGNGVLYAQDTIVRRIIFIGDAGEIDEQQDHVITTAAAQVLPGKTTVMFLGDNIYPRGMGLPGSAEESSTKEILQKQFVPFRAKGAAVYFIPGNHDWDRMGKMGLEKIKQQWQYLEQQGDSLLKMLPANGCADPFELNISDSLVIIGFDSEWWLFPYDKQNEDAGCDCNTKQEVLDKMGELLYKNRYKFILLASHHPFQSYGHHGGRYALKDHIFPLTAINPSLYIPLPLVGSLYPLLRKTFVNPEDMAHPLYKNMIQDIDGVFEGFPNLVHVAGHEHGLQFIKDKQIQVVSGSGAKEAFVKKGKHALFAETIPGFVTADLRPDNSLRFTYYVIKNGQAENAFTYVQPYSDVKQQEQVAASGFTTADSIAVRANAKYNSVSKLHRTLFGENYRKEWGAETKVPVIRLSVIKGGLMPTQRGGGHQSLSLRLKDNAGKEWVLRTVDKNPIVLIPLALRETFARDIVQDNMSAQHPYSALVVPPIAEAIGVVHTNPIIGLVAPDKNLGIYEKLFANTLCLLEEREPLGKSDNTIKMMQQLDKDNDNRFDTAAYLRAKVLDLMIGDWDRHSDQWRWYDEQKGSGKKYQAIPRDRDQVFYVNEGIFAKTASRPWILPYLEGFHGSIRNVNTFMYNGRQISSRFFTQFSYEKWMHISTEAINKLSDSVFENALSRLPASAKAIRYDQLLTQLKQRRTHMVKAMSDYYYFMSRVVDIKTTDKNEFVDIKNVSDTALLVNIYKLSKEKKIKELFYSRTFYPSETKEVRLFVSKGDDSVYVNNTSSPVRLRIIGGKGNKAYNVASSYNKIQLYDLKDNASFSGNSSLLHKHLSNDSANTAYLPSDPYNVTGPLIAAGYNSDDGLLLGAGIKHIHRGFRKLPYGSMHQLTFVHSFSTSSFQVKYKGEWLQAIGKADILLNGIIKAPNNTQNFFGVGNETPFDKTGNYKRYYRTRFNLYQLDAALRWRYTNAASFYIGPSVQFYHFDENKNKDRFITNPSMLYTYDSATIGKDKSFAGATAGFIYDKRNSKILPTAGGYFSLKLLAYTGLNEYSKSFMQIIPELSVYKAVDAQSSLVIANRIGGGITTGNAAFYQSLFLGGHENLLGYRQYRFAGQQMLYNNFEVRLKLANIASYILPGQIGLTGFYDIGRVWVNHDKSDFWHQGAGGGIYFAPAQMLVAQLVVGASREGWYPYFTLAMRY